MSIKLLYTAVAAILVCIIYFNSSRDIKDLRDAIVIGIITAIIVNIFIPSDISLFDIWASIKKATNNTGNVSPNIKLSINALDMINTDEYDLKCSTFPDNCDIKWSSDNVHIVKVDDNGHLKAISEGDATIKATITYNNVEYTDECNVKVIVPVINIYSSDIFYVGDTKSLSLYTFPREVNVIWKSNNSDIATVNENGEIKCIAEGTATITAIMAYNNRNYSADYDIRVNSILVNGTTPSDISGQNGGMPPEPSNFEPSKPEFFKPENVESALAFSDDVDIIIDSNSDYIFHLNGYISSNYELTCIKFDLTAPECSWTGGTIEYGEHGPKIYYFDDISSTINTETFDSGYEYNGDFELVITATDSSGKNISKTINWSYYELQ